MTGCFASGRCMHGPAAAGAIGRPFSACTNRTPLGFRESRSAPARVAALPALESFALDCSALSGAVAQHAPLASASLSAYELTRNLDTAVATQLATVTPVTYLVVLAAGLASSLSPCTLSVLPLTVGYIGGYTEDTEGPPPVVKAAAFASGLATTLALLGVASTALGTAYGKTGDTLPIIVGAVAMAMGLNLLGVLRFQLPSVDIDTRSLGVPPLLQAYLAGFTFALAASPCSTPILATLLAYTSTQQSPVLGGTLLLAYTSGYVVPLLVAASATGAMKTVLGLRQYSAWITPASGGLLLAGGTYTLLSRLT